ncbi:hypothetical protein CH76_11000 [Lysinibacillus sp. BF-4]|uniref:hypothetical protein n=1 Tax=Lysinibacillus sp. BF-4 TaxID=1473546 RepID=UPI000500206B|nr:hypothetical protein [Lysinibacillus sp. BF-4]KFL42661.1 hypothetical protein CH76_11000 [Lysinibacillus sp. BF-4]
MKFAFGLFAVLTGIIGGTLFFQYQTYSADLAAGNHAYYYAQEIETSFSNDELHVKHHFKGLPNQRMDIILPTHAKDVACLVEDTASCTRVDETMTYLTMGEATTQSISYTVPIAGGLAENKLLQNMFVQLKNGEVSYSILHMATDKVMAGNWITGLPFVGEQKLSMITNTMFSGDGDVRDLYWSVQPITLQQKEQHYSIYANEKPSADFLSEVVEVMGDTHIAIVKDPKFVTANTQEFLFLEALDVTTIENQILLTRLKQKYDFSKGEPWLVDVVATLALEREVGGKKAQDVLQTLYEEMTPEQVNEFKKRVLATEGKAITTQYLDSILREIFTMPTTYFEQNAATETGVFPLLFGDDREIYVNDYVKNDVNLVMKDGKVYYTADTLLPHLGYTAGEGNKGYYVNSAKSAYRFPRLPGFYVHNQTRHEVKSEPIIKIGDSYFIEEGWLQRIFHVEIDKNTGRIQMKVNLE